MFLTGRFKNIYLPTHTKLTWVAGGETINILSLALPNRRTMNCLLAYEHWLQKEVKFAKKYGKDNIRN